MSRTIWEYKCVDFCTNGPDPETWEKIFKHIKELGMDGWELVSTDVYTHTYNSIASTVLGQVPATEKYDNHHLWFKRELHELS